MTTVADPAIPHEPDDHSNEPSTDRQDRPSGIDWADLHPDVIVGVDTHRDTHTAVAITALGAVIDSWTVATTIDGLSELFTHIVEAADRTAELTGIDIPQIVWAIEGSASYGAGLREFLRATDPDVVMTEATGIGRGRTHAGVKNDTADAENIARDALAQILNYQQHLQHMASGTATGHDKRHDKRHRGQTTHRPPATPRQGGTREAICTIHTLRRANVATVTHRTNQFKALLIRCPEQIRARYRDLNRDQQMKLALTQRAPKSTGHAGADEHARTSCQALKQLARQVRDLRELIKDSDRELARLTGKHAPKLLQIVGLGEVGAAAVLGAWSHPGRIHSEAHFASLAGAAPLPVTSGKSGDRHRLNRGGDRSLHNVCWRVVQTRVAMREERTVAYLERRQREGKTRREAVRCLIRYVSREIWKALQDESVSLP